MVERLTNDRTEHRADRSIINEYSYRLDSLDIHMHGRHPRPIDSLKLAGSFTT
jgi:hypothetical protein